LRLENRQVEVPDVARMGTLKFPKGQSSCGIKPGEFIQGRSLPERLLCRASLFAYTDRRPNAARKPAFGGAATKKRHSAMILVLIGYRGCGKSAVAQLAALRLGWDWVDADVEIELRAGKSIAAIFADDGETAFRDLESAVLNDLLQRDRIVLALGGGVVLREENRKSLRGACQSGQAKIVWLKAAPEVLWERIQADKTTAARRPNLTVAGGLAEIRHLLTQREPLYQACADTAIDTEQKSLSQIAQEIASLLTPDSC
jgi:shikimate kinase